MKENLQEQIDLKAVLIGTADLSTLQAVKFQMEQLFTNLLINAIKFLRPGERPIITISSEIITGSSLAALSPTTPYHHITISNNGIGFETEYSERIFMVFQRLHPQEAYESTGIGLAICKRIIENHNGNIIAEGKVGAWSHFSP